MITRATRDATCSAGHRRGRGDECDRHGVPAQAAPGAALLTDTNRGGADDWAHQAGLPRAEPMLTRAWAKAVNPYRG